MCRPVCIQCFDIGTAITVEGLMLFPTAIELWL